jgi:hypothetical protein
MADHAAWAVGFARQAQADFQTFEKLKSMRVPECHKLQFLLDWTSTPSELLLQHAGPTTLKLILEAIERLLKWVCDHLCPKGLKAFSIQGVAETGKTRTRVTLPREGSMSWAQERKKGQGLGWRTG